MSQIVIVDRVGSSLGVTVYDLVTVQVGVNILVEAVPSTIKR
jgi:hypothetical protein